MPDVNDPTNEPEDFSDLPMQPTGSGPADLEIAYEQMRLAESEAGTTGEPAAADLVERDIATDPADDVANSEAHPS